MTWFKVDDSLADHPKTHALQELKGWERSFALWLLGGSHCAKHLTDGLISRATVRRLGFSERDANNLVNCGVDGGVGFWEPSTNGWQYHDWTDWQPSKEQVVTERKRNAERQQRARDKHRDHPRESRRDDVHGHAVTDGVTTTVSNDAPSRPVPSRPDQARSDDLKPPPDLHAATSAPMRRTEPRLLRDSAGLLDPDSLRRRALWILGRMRDVHGGTGAYDFGMFRDELEALARQDPAEMERALRTYETDPWVPANRPAATPQNLLKRFEGYVVGNPSGRLTGPVRAKPLEDSDVIDELGVM